MFAVKRSQPLVALVAAPLLFSIAQGVARAQSFNAPLVKCTAVTDPATLSNCPGSNDPLKEGYASINGQGDVTVAVAGAATNTTYAVKFLSEDGSTSTSLGSFMTGPKGDGFLRKLAFFKFGVVGAGNVVLENATNQIEFISGVTISSNGLESAADFQPGLVRCADVVVPAALAGCGSDPLKAGRVDVENDDGAMSIHIAGATPGQSYPAIFRSPNGTSTALGTVGPTNSHGDASLDMPNAFAAGTVGAGSIVLQRNSQDQFESGFKVDRKFVPPPVSAAGLVRCAEVTDPVLSSCGSDPLTSGAYEVNAAGRILARIEGASPSTNYEIWFRPLDNSGDVDTGIKLPTNSQGNGAASGAFFSAGTLNAGTLVVKEQSTPSEDQYVAGFEAH